MLLLNQPIFKSDSTIVSATATSAKPLAKNLLKMLIFLLFLLVPFTVLGIPTSFSLGQLTLELPNSLEAQDDTTLPPSVIQLDGPSPAAGQANAPSPSAISLVYQFSEETLENLHVRSNGQLILSVVNKPLMYTIDPTKPRGRPTLVYNFTSAGVTSLLGVAEYAPDVFAVVTGNWTTPAPYKPRPGSFSIHSVDFNTPKPTVKLISKIPEALALNGMASLHGGYSDTILVVDSHKESIWKLDVTTGEYSLAIQSPLFGNSTTNPMGINGIRAVPGYVYFSNTAQMTYGRVPVDDNATPTGEVQILARADSPAAKWDDFDLDWEGNAWVGTHAGSVYEVTVEGKQRNVTGVENPTSARFGRGSKQQEKILYLSTTGNATVAGQVIALNTCLL